MKKVLFYILFIFIQLFEVAPVYSQQGAITKYFSRNNEEVTKDQSFYYETKNGDLNKGDTILAFYTHNDKVRSLSIVGEHGSPDGSFLRYHENGQLKSKGVLKKARPSGTVMSFYPDGKVQAEEIFNLEGESMMTESMLMNYYDSTGNQLIKDGNGNCVCYFSSFEWDGFSEAGKLLGGKRDSVWTGIDTRVGQKFTELYENGKLISGESYDAIGNLYKYNKLEEDPAFKGGLAGLYKEISRSIKYPRDARKAGIQGTVYVEFVVTKYGPLDKIKVIKGISESCNQEAIHAVTLLNEWTPGKIRGVPVNVKFVLPIKFKLG